MCASVLRFSVALPVYTVHFILKLLCFVLLFVCFTTRGCAQSRDVRALCKCEKNLITSIALSASGGRAASASSAEHRPSPKPKKKIAYSTSNSLTHTLITTHVRYYGNYVHTDVATSTTILYIVLF